MSRSVCAIQRRSPKSSVISSSLVFNLFNFSTIVESIHEMSSITNSDHAFAGIRGGQPGHTIKRIYHKTERLL